MTYWDCVLHGGYAGGTVGDEIALGVALGDAADRFGPRVAVLSRDPAYTRGLFPDATVIPYDPIPTKRGVIDRWLFRDPVSYRPDGQVGRDGLALPWVEAVRKSANLYLVGGGYLNDVWDIHFPLLPARIAAEAGVPISTAPVQVGPFFGSASRRCVADALRSADLRVRDRSSCESSSDIGLGAHAAVDDVFRAREVIEGLEARTRGDDIARIGVCIFRQNGCTQPAFDSWWVEFLRTVAMDSNIEIEGFGFHNYPGYDAADCIDLFSKAGLEAGSVLPPPTDFRSAARNLGRYDAVISCRFHAVVASCLLGIPAVAFADGAYYKQKLTAVWPPEVPRFIEAGIQTPPVEVAEQLVGMAQARA